ncbi:hypothetical protein [Heyndrickxia coagulans]|jgi:hypothetical protein|nr:hypothetical protein [Heyndrickxia coagulans]
MQNIAVKKERSVQMGRQKYGNQNAERNKNAKLGNEVAEELVEFSTGRKDEIDQKKKKGVRK